MITLGVILILLGIFIHPLAFLWIIGVIVLIVGVVLFAMGSMGRAVGGRKHYY